MSQLKPVLNNITLAVRMNWHDEFDGDLSRWHQDDFTGPTPHKTGNKYLTKSGVIDTDQKWSSVPGRWAGLYDKHRNVVQRVEAGNLVLRGVVTKEPNPCRENFTDSKGVEHPYGDYKLYAPWLSTATHIQGPDGLEIDPNSIKGLAMPGTVTEIRVNLTKQMIRGLRFNLWFMPVKGNAYDGDVSTVEIDAPEVEHSSRTEKFGDSALMKVVGGEAGDTPGGVINLTDLDVNLREGWHTFTTLWNFDGTLVFLIDGKVARSDLRSVTMTAYLIMAFEWNSGVKEAPGPGKRHNDWENYQNGPRRPVDPGLTAQSCILDIDLVSEHEVRVDYLRVWNIVSEKIDGNPLPDVKQPDIYLEPVKELSVDEEIAELADLYERAETRILQLHDANAELLRQISDLRDSNATLLDSRKNALEVILCHEKTERDLLARINELTQELASKPKEPEQGPPVTEQSRARLRTLLSRARSANL